MRQEPKHGTVPSFGCVSSQTLIVYWIFSRNVRPKFRR